MEEVTEEVVLHFKRFGAEKQDQIRALVNYATLMGLSGKDLVSIGGKLERIKVASEVKYRKDITDGMLQKCTLVGEDRKRPKVDHTRFVYTDASGRKWRFEDITYYRLTVISDTKVKKYFNFDRYALGRCDRWNMRQALMNVHDGVIQLNF